MTFMETFKKIEDLNIDVNEALFNLTLEDNDNLQKYYYFAKIPAFRIQGIIQFAFYPYFMDLKNESYIRIIEDAPDRKRALYVLAEELEKFGLMSVIIQAELASEFNKYSGDILEIRDFLKFLKVKQIRENIDFFISLSSQEREIKKKYMALSLRKDAIEILLMLDKEIQDYLIDLFFKINFSLNDKIQVIQWIFDIIKSGRKKKNTLMEEIRVIISEKKNTAAEHIITYLKKVRYPLLTELTSKINEIVKQIESSNIKLVYDKTLESDEITLSLKIDNMIDFDEIIDKITRKKKLFSDIFDKKSEKI